MLLVFFVVFVGLLFVCCLGGTRASLLTSLKEKWRKIVGRLKSITLIYLYFTFIVFLLKGEISSMVEQVFYTHCVRGSNPLSLKRRIGRVV